LATDCIASCPRFHGSLGVVASPGDLEVRAAFLRVMEAHEDALHKHLLRSGYTEGSATHLLQATAAFLHSESPELCNAKYQKAPGHALAQFYLEGRLLPTDSMKVEKVPIEADGTHDAGKLREYIKVHSPALEVGSEWWRVGPRDALAQMGGADKVDIDSTDEVRARYLYRARILRALLSRQVQTNRTNAFLLQVAQMGINNSLVASSPTWVESSVVADEVLPAFLARKRRSGSSSPR